MSQYKIVEGPRASKFFLDACEVYYRYGPEVHCEYCGRTYYTVDDNFSDTCLTEKDADIIYKENPDGYILDYTTDGFDVACFGGKEIIVNCECNGLRAYEDFVWKNKQSIRYYLKSRIEQEAIWANEQLSINKLMGID